MTLRRQSFSQITLWSLLDAIKTFEIIYCAVSSGKIYRHQRGRFLALVLVVTRVCSSTLRHLFPELNPISLFGNFTCTSSNIIYCISCIKCCKLYIGETGRRRSDRFVEHLRSVKNNDVNTSVARHVNTANQSGGNGCRKRQIKCLFFKIVIIYPHGLNKISFVPSPCLPCPSLPFSFRQFPSISFHSTFVFTINTSQLALYKV